MTLERLSFVAPTHRPRPFDHWRYRKDLADGTSLRTKVSHSLRDEIGVDLFRHILREQLQITEERFWDVVRGRAATVGDVPPLPAETVPGWLVQQLLLTVGLPEDAVRAMTRAEAHAAWDDYRTRPK
jgi:hypothetical protein